MRVRRCPSTPEARMARSALQRHGHPDAHVYRLEVIDGVMTEVAATVPDGEVAGRRVAVTARLWASGDVELLPGWD